MGHAGHVIVYLSLLASPVLAAEPPPYAGEDERPIKALSAADVDGYHTGRGMGLAKAAELNGYPGPMHVLQQADALGLTPDQRARTQHIMDDVKRRAREIGARIVEREQALDRAFAGGNAEPASVIAIVRQIGELQAELRLAHLLAHLPMRDVLTPPQIEQYNSARSHAASTRPVHGSSAR
ncbi:MAG TPA: periplasmic heavy metal sensor [Tepidisphaeraceae bacterium]|nr:periplasmic heavy metal sensor [Tepidisphaeraceae bacterium]